jgi:hypothetical protein
MLTVSEGMDIVQYINGITSLTDATTADTRSREGYVNIDQPVMINR